MVPNAKKCAVKGIILNGANCAETNTGKTSELTYEELVDFLQAAPERPDPDGSGKMLPAKGAAIIVSSEDAFREKVALEVACRQLGKRCTFEIKQTIKTLDELLVNSSRHE